MEDIDFGRRLKAYGWRLGKRYGTIGRHGITTSCPKFDQFGDWYQFRNPQLVKAIFDGTDRHSADVLYYDTGR